MSPRCPTSNQLPVYGLWKQKMAQFLGPLHPCEDLEEAPSSWLLTLDWPSSSCRGHSGRESVGRRSLSLSNSTFPIKDKFLKFTWKYLSAKNDTECFKISKKIKQKINDKILLVISWYLLKGHIDIWVFHYNTSTLYVLDFLKFTKIPPQLFS